MMTSEATAVELRNVLESLRIIQVTEVYPGEDHVLMYCRLNEEQMERWAHFVQSALIRESEVNQLSGQEVVRFEFSRQYRYIRGKFGYSWKVFVWARDVAKAVNLLSGCLSTPPSRQHGGGGAPTRRPPEQKDVVRLPHRSGDRNNPDGKMTTGAMGKQIPSERGAYGKGYP